MCINCINWDIISLERMDKTFVREIFMKKRISIIFILIICIIFCGCTANNNSDEGYSLIRIHIRANSNGKEDQAVKLKVRDAITAYLDQPLSGVTDFDTAYSIIEKHQNKLKSAAVKVLKNNGFSYGVSIRLGNEYFPARSYENIVVESGYYDALIIELGTGEGDNWWCVIYPPLCFVGAENTGEAFKYKSKIKELWDKYIS